MASNPILTEIDAHVGYFFYCCRDEAKQGLFEVARATQIDVNALSGIEMGTVRASAEDLYHLCRHFEVEPDDVYAGFLAH